MNLLDKLHIIAKPAIQFYIYWKTQMLIACDIDGVVANQMLEWLKAYNRDFDDCLQVSDILDYDIRKFVKPEAKDAIFSYLTPELYDTVLPLPEALYSIEQLRALGHRVYFATQAQTCPGRKFHWLVEHGFLQPKEYENYVEATDKSWLRADAMIDDSEKQLKHFRGEKFLTTKIFPFGQR